MATTGARVPRALSLVAAVTLVVAACGGGTSGGGSGGGGEAAAGGTVYMLMTTDSAGSDQFQDMDPQRAYTGEDMAFFSATIRQSLTAYKYSTDPTEATTLVPDSATDLGTANADATEWKFTLRDGLKWQDGTPVTCADYAYGTSRVFATDVIVGGPTYAIAYLDIPSNEDGSSQYPGPYTATPEQQALYDAAVSCDGNTITFKLNQGVADFNYTVTLGFGAVPNPKDHPGADTGEGYTTAPWSDGPYMIEGYTPGKGGNLTLVRNPNWDSSHDGGYRGAYPDKWVVQLGLDPAIVDQRLMASKDEDAFALQYGFIQPENLATIFTDPKTTAPDYAGRAFSDFDPYASYIWIRNDKVPNVKIRQAMAVALDRAALQANAGGDFAGELGDGVIKPNIGQDYAPTGWATDLFGAPIPPEGDPELAKKLIAESGEPAPTLTYDYGKGAVGDKAAAIVQDSLQKAGFTINLNPIESGYYGFIFDTEKQHEFGGSGWGADWPNASTVIPPLLTPTGGFGLSRVEDPAWLAKVKDAQTTLDRAAQAKKWQDLNREAMQQVYVIPTVFGLAQNIAGNGLGNVYKWAPYGSWSYGQIYVKQ